MGAIGAGTEIGAVTIGSSDNGTITLNGAITTTGAVSLDGPVSLATGAITVDSSAGDAAINFLHTIDGAQNLTLSSGGGAINVAQGIGLTNALSALTINSAGSGTIEIFDIGDDSVGVTGATAIGNTSTTTLTLDGTVYKTTGAQVYTATGGDNIDITNTSNAAFTTTNTAITFGTANIELANGVAVSYTHLTLPTTPYV